MKKKSVLAIAIVAIVAAVASVSFAAWNAIAKENELVNVDVTDQVNLEVTYNSATIAEGTKLAPKDTENNSIIMADSAKVVRELKIGDIAADFKKVTDATATAVTVNSHKITVTLSENNANLQYTLKATGKSDIVLTSTNATADLEAGVTYEIHVSFIADADSISEADAKAVAGKSFGAKFTVNAVKKTA